MACVKRGLKLLWHVFNILDKNHVPSWFWLWFIKGRGFLFSPLSTKDFHLQLLGVKIVFKEKLSPEQKALAVVLHQEFGHSFLQIADICNVSTSSTERICKSDLFQRRNPGYSRKTGRPRKISFRMKRLLKINLLKLRRDGVAVTAERPSDLQWTKFPNRKSSHVFPIFKWDALLVLTS